MLWIKNYPNHITLFSSQTNYYHFMLLILIRVRRSLIFQLYQICIMRWNDMISWFNNIKTKINVNFSQKNNDLLSTSLRIIMRISILFIINYFIDVFLCFLFSLKSIWMKWWYFFIILKKSYPIFSWVILWLLIFDATSKKSFY